MRELGVRCAKQWISGYPWQQVPPLVPGNKASLEEFRIEWATFKLKKLADPFASQPLRRIRDYFGEAIAFYFVWVG